VTDARTEPAAPLPGYVVVVPTLGRPCLQACLDALAGASGPLPRQVVLADDRRDTPDPLPVCVPAAIADHTVTVTLEGRGPASARNAGWRAAEPAEWVAFLDDDVRIVLLLSASGRSQNVLAAAERARSIGLTVWAMTGPAPNPLAALADDAICVAGVDTAVVQEVHLVAIHALCDALDAQISEVTAQ
jgi:glycosyltransferase involved in cell wall biosynthesis